MNFFFCKLKILKSKLSVYIVRIFNFWKTGEYIVSDNIPRIHIRSNTQFYILRFIVSNEKKSTKYT